jgi:4-hydroxy-tetrahydrodipicolinate synthase
MTSQRSQHPLAGVYAAAVTPLHAPDSPPDLDALPAWMRFLASRGCHGVVLFGTTGEGPSFSPAERGAVMRAVMDDPLDGFRMIAGTGTPSLSETIELTRLAFDLGYDAALIVPPYYFRKASDDGLFDWFSTVIRKAVPSDKYVIGYHIPPLIGVGFSLELLARLKDAFPTQFAGIKDSSHDPDFARSLGEKFGADLVALNGTDSYMKLAMENRAAGCITAPANLISPDLREVWDLMVEGRDSTKAQERVTRKRHLLEKYPPFPPTLKALLHRMHDLPRWAVKPPLVPISAELEEQVLQEFQNLEG